MGDYATTAQLKARFEDDEEVSHLTDSADTGSPDETVLAEVLDDAEAEMNGYIGVRYSIPVTVSGNAILANRMKSLALDLAVVKLVGGRGGIISEAKRDLRTDAIAWLKGLAAGTIVLPSAVTEPSTQSREPLAEWGIAGTGSASQRVFTRATQERL